MSGIAKARNSALATDSEIVWVDEKRVLAFVRRASEARQDQHAWIFGVLRGYILLGHEIHSIAERRHQAYLRRTIETGKRRPAVGPVDILDWGPGHLSILAVDAARRRADRMLQLLILWDAASALWRDLEVGDLSSAIPDG